MLNQPTPAKSPNYVFTLSVLANLSFAITIAIPNPTTNYFAQLSVNSSITPENLQSLLESLKTSP